LRRPVDRPSLFPCSRAADHAFEGTTTARYDRRWQDYLRIADKPTAIAEHSIGTRFRQVFFPDDVSWRIELVDPPFGGIGTHDGLISAIRQVGFETFKIPVTQLQKSPDSVSCEMENEWP
jgi:hypothetical protein